MNAPKLRTLTRRHNLVTLLVASLSTIVFAYGVMSGAAQSPAKQDGGTNSNIQRPLAVPGPFGEDIAKEFNDDDLKVKQEKVRGKWAFGLVFDQGQLNDSSVPVAVGGIQSLSGAGKHLGVTKIKRVEIKNRAPKILSSVQLRWTITSLDDRNKVLSEDTAPFVNTWVEANSSQVIEFPALYPRLMLKTLAKNGELYGEFMITIGVQEARFADGSFWRRPAPVAYLKFLYLYPPYGICSPALASLGSGISPPTIKPSSNQSRFKPCEAQPRSAASAVSLMPFQMLSCRNNTAVREDDEGRRSCGLPAPNIACYSDCSSTGHCNVWQASGPCDLSEPTPPPPPPSPPPPCPEPKPADCCQEVRDTIPGSTIKNCEWDCRNCPPGITFADGCFSTGGPVVCPDGYEFTSKPGRAPPEFVVDTSPKREYIGGVVPTRVPPGALTYHPPEHRSYEARLLVDSDTHRRDAYD